MNILSVQGRRVTPDDLNWIRQLIGNHRHWGRSQLSVHIAQQWNWRNDLGRLKDMAARSLLLKLERRGLIVLPPRQQHGNGNHKAHKVHADPDSEGNLFPQLRIEAPLERLLPLRITQVHSSAQRRILGRWLQQHHYLGYYRSVGESVSYLIYTRSAQPLACAVFGAAAWKCAPRDRFIGWSAQDRQKHLQSLANNMRLLILPWVRVPQLGAHLLGRLARGLSADWQRRYGHPIYLLESFVERERFAGTAYRAANWVCVGQTQGRGRQGSDSPIRSTTLKDIYLFPLHPRFRQHLREPSTQHPLTPESA